MASVTFSVPDEVKSQMKEFSWVNWSELAREKAVKQAKLREEFEKFKKIVSRSKFTEDDADKLSEKVKSSMHKFLKEKGLV